MKPFAVLAFALTALLLTGCRPSPEKLLATANKYHDSKKYKEADILYQKVIAKEKTNAEAYYREGLNLLSEGDPVQASKFLRRAVDLNPKNSDAVNKLSEIYLTAYLSNPAKFKNLLPDIQELESKLLKQDPNSYAGWRLKALLAYADHNNDEALQDFAKANQIKPYSRDLMGWYAQALVTAGKADEAEKLVRGTLDRDKTWDSGYALLFALAGQTKDRAKQEAILREHLQADPKSASAIVNLSNFLLTTGRYDAAESTMKRVVADKSTFPNGRELMGDFYSRARHYDLAIQQYQDGAKEDEKNALRYQQRMVLMYSLMGRAPDALKLVRDLAQKHPKDSVTSEMYASLLLDTGLRSDTANSLAELKSLVKKDPANPILHLDLARAYMASNKLNDALNESLESLQEEAKQKSQRSNVIVPGRLVAARIYEARGQHALALEQTQQILQAAPNQPEGRLLHDEALVNLGQAEQALPDLQKLVAQVDAANVHTAEANEARLWLGRLLAGQKNYAGANAQFEAVWKSNPPDIRGFEALQEVKMAQGKADDAVAAMTDLVNKNPAALVLRLDLANLQGVAGSQLIRSNPERAKTFFEASIENYKQVLKTNSNSEVWTRLGLLQRQLGQNDAALASFEQATNTDPQNTGAMVNRAALLEALNRKKEASELYNRILGIDPNNILALNNLAFINADDKTNLEQAQSFAERAKQKAPNSPDISDTLGYVYYQRNLNSEALQIFKQDVQEHPENSTFHLHLAMALLKQGDKSGAREEAARAMKTAPPNQQDRIKSFVNQIG